MDSKTLSDWLRGWPCRIVRSPDWLGPSANRINGECYLVYLSANNEPPSAKDGATQIEKSIYSVPPSIIL